MDYYSGVKDRWLRDVHYGDRNTKRTQPVSRITIHCVAGYWETLNSFRGCMQDREYEASWTYGVAGNGDVGQYLSESMRPWTSSSYYNDDRAITMEVSNHPDAICTMTDASIAAVINLCEDICVRHNIRGLYYTGDIRTSNITLHRWFEYKSCPGDYLVSKLPYITETVNNRLRLKHGMTLAGSYKDPVTYAQYTANGSILRTDIAYKGGANRTGTSPGKLIAIAANEIGYIGKTSRKDLDDPTANTVGKYTKYARDLHEAGYYQADKNGYDWCTIFVDWCMWVLHDKDRDKAQSAQYVTDVYGAGVGPSKAHYMRAGKLGTVPHVGDEIFFGDSHTGIVYDFDDTYVYTIEGNTDNSSVAKKKHIRSQSHITYGTPNYDNPDDITYDDSGIVYDPWDPSSPNYGEDQYGATYLPFEYLDETRLYQYVATLDRNSPSIEWKDLQKNKISAVVIEAGYLFNSAHAKQKTFKSPKFYEQIHAADDADVPIGLWMTCRATSEDEAKAEMQELKSCIQVANVAAGVWLHLKLTKTVTTNDKIVRVYRDKLHELGLHKKIGFYVTSEELEAVTWDEHCEDWYLWLVDHVAEENIDLLDDLLTPEFFQIERSEHEEDWVVDKDKLQTNFGAVQPGGNGPVSDPDIESTFGEQIEVVGGRYEKRHTYTPNDYSLNYALFLPKVVRSNMPLVCWLHGDGEAGNVGYLTTNLGMIKAVNQTYGENFPFIFVCPNRPSWAYWNSELNTTCVKSILDTVARQYQCNTDKIIISGHSGGSIGCWEMMHDYGDYFSAAVPVSCNSQAEINDNMAAIPTWSFCGNIGSSEQIYNRGMQKNVDDINARGGNARHTTLDVDHGTAGSAAYTQDTFNWMLGQ